MMNDGPAVDPGVSGPPSAGGKARSTRIRTAVLTVVGMGALIAVIVMATRSDDGESASVRRSRSQSVKGRPQTPASTATNGANTAESSRASTTTSTTASAPTTPTTSSTGPSISYLTAPASIVCDTHENERTIDVTLRAERVTTVSISGDQQASRQLVATAANPEIVGTVPMNARCSTTNDFVVKATGTDGSTVERHVTVVARVRPPAVGS